MLYPIGIQNFKDLRNGGYVYVDKTDKIYNLVSTGKYYFLSRPRRFGKSLLVSTMEVYFQGKSDLFKGLAMESLEKDWMHYPVLHLDLGGKTYLGREDLDSVLDRHLNEWEALYGIGKRYPQPDMRFHDIIEGIYRKTGAKVVVLIDEYDKPVIDNLDNHALQEYYRSVLQGFYGVMKSEDECIRFGFLTGVTKIGKLSVFSGLNNLNDISMDSIYADICGISEDDLHEYFDGGVGELAEANGLSVEECYARLKKWYDGYHFSEDSPGIYNPFSLLNTLQKRKFHKYWFETGTPTFLVKVMQRTSFDITALSDEEVDSSLLSTVNTVLDNPIPLLHQSGYLTVTGYDSEYGLYRLGFPNIEVKTGFLNFIFQYYIPGEQTSGMTLILKMSRALREGRPEDMMQLLDSLFARANYQIQGDVEKDFHYAMYIIFELMGTNIQTERQTSNGRIDLLIQTDRFIYVIELKVDSSAEEALRQIGEKGYAKPFASDSRRLYRIGVNFSTSTRRIEEWKIE